MRLGISPDKKLTTSLELPSDATISERIEHEVVRLNALPAWRF